MFLRTIIFLALLSIGTHSQSNDYVFSLESSSRHYQINGDTVKSLSSGKPLYSFRDQKIRDLLLQKTSYYFKDGKLFDLEGHSLIQVTDRKIIDLRSNREIMTYSPVGIFDAKSGEKVMKLTAKISPAFLSLIAIGVL